MEDNPTAAGASVEASITVEVKRLDHGDTGRLSVRDIKELTQQMADVPLQAMQVSLANVSVAALCFYQNELIDSSICM